MSHGVHAVQHEAEHPTRLELVERLADDLLGSHARAGHEDHPVQVPRGNRTSR